MLISNIAQKRLRKLISKKNVQYLNPDEKLSQFQRSRSFMDGLKQAEAAFKLQYEVTARGISRAYWSDNVDKVADVCGKYQTLGKSSDCNDSLICNADQISGGS